jgi:hypothetical protein
MWRFPVVLPQTGDPMDPDRVHGAMQPFSDGAVDLDEHDLVSGGFTNTSGVLTDLVVAGRAGKVFDPGIQDGVSDWNTGLADAQEFVPGDTWAVVNDTTAEKTTGGGLVWITGFVQWGLDFSSGFTSARVSLALLIDGSPYLKMDVPQCSTVNVDHAGSRIIPGESGHAGVETLDLFIPLAAGEHTFQLALHVLGLAGVYAFNRQLTVIEFRC